MLPLLSSARKATFGMNNMLALVAIILTTSINTAMGFAPAASTSAKTPATTTTSFDSSPWCMQQKIIITKPVSRTNCYYCNDLRLRRSQSQLFFSKNNSNDPSLRHRHPCITSYNSHTPNERNSNEKACFSQLYSKAVKEEEDILAKELAATAAEVVTSTEASNTGGTEQSTNNLQFTQEKSNDEIATTTTSNSNKNNNNNQIPPEFIQILTLCWCVTLLSALDRVAMSIAILPLSTEFHYTETIKGSISSAVSYGYGAAILPIGLLVSVVSSRKLMIVGVLLWSVATIGTPFMAELSESLSGSGSGSGIVSDGGNAVGLLVDGDANAMTTKFIVPLVAIRAIMGAAEAVVLPTMQRILANWVPPEKKATVLAIVLSGFQFGTVSAYLVSPWVMDFMTGLDGGGGVNGWRGMFYVYGMAGLLWLVPWWFIAKDAPSTTNAEMGVSEDCQETFVNNMIEDDASLVLKECPISYVDEIGDGETRSETKAQDFQALLQSAPWSDFLRSRGVWGMTLAHAAKNFFLYNLLAWTPTFYSEQYGLNVKESALYSILPSVCGMIGGLTAGNSADYILTKYVSGSEDMSDAAEKRTKVRKLFQAIALLGPAASITVLSNLPEDVTVAQILLGLAVGLQAFDAAGFGAATQEKAGNRWAGLLYSLTSLPGVMIGSISVSVTGQLLDMMPDNASGWAAVFQLNAAVCVAGALSFLLLYDSKKEFE